MLSKVFGLQKGEVTGYWGTLKYKDLHYLQLTRYYSGNKIKKNEMGRARSKFRDKDKFI